LFRIYPAIDIRGGRCVRLHRGDYTAESMYFMDPLQAVREWVRRGASFLHVVDLDGAVEGRPVNSSLIRRMIEEAGIPLQVGGGIRELDHAREYLEAGAARVILGTRAILDPDFLVEAIALWGERILVSVDVGKEGKPSLRGWTETVSVDKGELLTTLREAGVTRMIHTNIWRDGTLEGYDPGPLEPFLDQGMKLIAAGGITTLRDLRLLKGLSARGVEGAIIGKALYEGSIHLEEALQLEILDDEAGEGT
jgi:phosphoribosylformimino-5-aminoimidazole carboxamide ribotide isomerase